MIERDDPQDKDLAALYREAAGEQPSAGLDARILAAARSAAAPPKVATASWIERWKVPFALAATVVLTTTVTLLVRDEEDGRLSVPESKPELVAKSAPAPRPADAAPAPVPAIVAERDARQLETQGTTAARNETLAAKKEAPAPDSAQPAGSGAAEQNAPAVARSADELRSEPVKAQASPERSRVETEVASSAARPAAPAAAAPRAMTAAPAPAPAPAPAQSFGAKRANGAEGAGTRTPEKWLAEIRKLKQEGKAAEAEASLVEFRKRYPQYQLPDDLKTR